MFVQSVNQQIADSMNEETEQRWDGQPRDSDGRFDKGKRRRLVRSGAKRKNSEKSSRRLEKLDKNDIIKSRGITIGKSVGAAGKNYPVRLPNGNHTKLAEGTKITKVRVFAGKGTNTPIRNSFYFESTYKIKANEWQKVRGEGTVVFEGKNRTAELHWYEADGERVQMKVKRYYDESERGG